VSVARVVDVVTNCLVVTLWVPCPRGGFCEIVPNKREEGVPVLTVTTKYAEIGREKEHDQEDMRVLDE
jgi:hypothetical protein